MGDLINSSSASPLLFALVVVLVLVLIGVLAFGVGGAVIADRGIGAGVFGAVRVGKPSEHFVVANANANREGIAPLPRWRRPVPRQRLDNSTSAGLWDTSQGQSGIGGDHMTTMGYEDKYIHGINYMRPLGSL